MGTRFLTLISLALIFIPSLFALPLTAIIFHQSAELAKKVTAWNKQCGDKPSYKEHCFEKRQKLSGELGQFVATVNEELDGLRDISSDASDDFVKEINGRRKIMELEVRNALYIIKCLGVPSSEPQCSAESAAIDEEKGALQAEYKQTHAAFDGTWISLRALDVLPQRATTFSVRAQNLPKRNAARNENELDVKVPKTAAAKQKSAPIGLLVVNVKADGTVVVNRRTLTSAELSELLKALVQLNSEQAVVIRGDEAGVYKNIIGVLNICTEAGITDVAFATAK